MNLATIDMTVPDALWIALPNALAVPVLLLATRLIAPIAESHALRFLLTAVVALAVWAACMAAFGHTRLDEIVLGLCLMLGTLLFYLEVWGLMTRGYSLGILLTLFKAQMPMTEQEIFARYRDGDGLNWIMQHRLGGLSAGGAVRRDGDRLALSPLGVCIARVYGTCIAVLGLRQTG